MNIEKCKKYLVESICGFILWSIFLTPYMFLIVKVDFTQYLAWLSMQIFLVTPIAPIVFRITKYVNKKIFGDVK